MVRSPSGVMTAPSCSSEAGRKRSGAAQLQVQLLAIHPAHQVLLVVAGNHLAVVDDRYLIAEFFCFFQVMRGEQDSRACFIEFLHICP